MEKECLFCETKFTPKNPKGKFCSDKCKVAYGRKNKGQNVPQKQAAASSPAVIKKEVTKPAAAPKIAIQDLNKETGKVIPVTDPKPKQNIVITTGQPMVNKIKVSLSSELKKLGYNFATEKPKYVPPILQKKD